jgi:hypothetical protein
MKHILKGLLLSIGLGAYNVSFAANPIIPNQGVNDPHIHIFNGKAYLYATHDKSADNTTFIMEDWWIWSSEDLVNWTLESVLDPEDTYIGKGFESAWATDAAEKNGKYYWYFSEANEQTGVVVGETPIGPWKDVLGRPLLTSIMTPTHEYDPGILKDGQDHYIIFGAFNYHIAKLNDDMISLSETPKLVEVINAKGPYTDTKDGPFAGKGTDDKPFLHKRNDIYYLSWGAFYATSDNPYGPYTYRGELLNDASFKDGTESPTWPQGYLQGRHGSFFEMNGQTYFAYCDISQTGNRYFRDTFISYVHYRDDGTINPLRVDLTGVGEYNANKGKIEAEDFFNVEGFTKVELSDGGFGVVPRKPFASITFPNIHGLSNKSQLTVRFSNAVSRDAEFEVYIKNPEGGMDSIGKLKAEKNGWWQRLLGQKQSLSTLNISGLKNTETLIIKSASDAPISSAIIDSFSFK